MEVVLVIQSDDRDNIIEEGDERKRVVTSIRT